VWSNKSQWIVFGLIAVLVAVFSLGVWLPESRKLAGYQERIVTAQEQLGPSFFEPAMMDKRMTEVQALKDEISSSARYVPERSELAPVLRALTEAVESRGVDNQRFQARESKHYKHYAELPLSLEFEDTFDVVYGVLQEIESLPRLVRLEAMSLRVLDRDRKQEISPVMQASLRLNSFYTAREEK